MSLTPRPRFAPGDTVTSAWANILDDDFSALDLRTGGDPGVAGKLQLSSGPLAGGWLAPGTEAYPLKIVSGVPAYAQLTGAGISTTPGSRLGTDHYETASITGDKISGTTITGDKIAAATITGAKISTTPGSRLGTDHYETASITNDKLAAGINASDSSALQGVTWKAPLIAGSFPAQVLTTSYTDVAGLSVSLSRTGTWLLIATIRYLWDPAGGDASQTGNTDLTVNGVEVTTAGDIRFANAGTDQDQATFMQVVTIASQPQTASVRAKKSGGSGSAQARSGQLAAVWLAP